MAIDIGVSEDMVVVKPGHRSDSLDHSPGEASDQSETERLPLCNFTADPSYDLWAWT